ncbi:hypothetical protein [Halorubrum tebenquichense]|uniref:Poly-gamma-glutamate synthesis protein (Capsule biosynthesis protein) n=1 Tax=Halorubrum tebenquichense DSM 14210 TaxID=1227485 RepID=M0DWD6_9EURY|nr:hypothetical protein [Halorubrum tebenquichense]ELZ39128.1 poly-gamma-glutamate synthesis protein (capsule biosynthesis protein) [Halorubrum tebenquichense DSM 14210]
MLSRRALLASGVGGVTGTAGCAAFSSDPDDDASDADAAEAAAADAADGDADAARIGFVGDLMLGRSVAERSAPYDTEVDGTDGNPADGKLVDGRLRIPLDGP